jgi:hypothetical protein
MALTKLYHVDTRKPVNDLYETVIKPKIDSGDIVPGQLVYSDADGEVSLSDDHDTEYPVGIIEGINPSYATISWGSSNYLKEKKAKYFYDRMIKLCKKSGDRYVFKSFFQGVPILNNPNKPHSQKILMRLISECCPLLNSMLLNPPLNKHGYKILL